MIALALVALLAASPPPGLPDVAGTYRLNRALSQDARTRIADAAGPDALQGADGDRLALRRQLLEGVKALDDLEVTVADGSVTLVHGQGHDVRTFYLDREHVRNDAQGRPLRCRTRWTAAQLVIEEEAEGGTRFTAVLTPVPARRQLALAVKVESRALPRPLDFSLLYDRATAP